MSGPLWVAWQEEAVGGAQKCRETSELGRTSRSRALPCSRSRRKVTAAGAPHPVPTCCVHASVMPLEPGTSSVPQFPPLENRHSHHRVAPRSTFNAGRGIRWLAADLRLAIGDPLLGVLSPDLGLILAHSGTAVAVSDGCLGPFRVHGRQVRPSGDSYHRQTLLLILHNTSLLPFG